jgi:hypothetical protein
LSSWNLFAALLTEIDHLYLQKFLHKLPSICVSFSVESTPKSQFAKAAAFSGAMKTQ